MITATRTVVRAIVLMIVSGIVVHCVQGWLDNPATFSHWPLTLGAVAGSLISDVLISRRKPAA